MIINAPNLSGWQMIEGISYTNHPFYIIGKGWVTAGELEAGDEVYRLDGSTAVMTGSELERLAEPIKNLCS
ncbi:MAG: HINT domain-containing protein [Candidatus Gastranaerophilales bacterium]|nr:HINT domain-containing protein [Candidatus Gastranaerophilales bacterium]